MINSFRHVAEEKEVIKTHDEAVEHYHYDTSFKIKPISDPKYTERLRKLKKPYDIDISLNRFSAEKDIQLTGQAVAECLLVDWDNFQMTKEQMKEDFPKWKYKADKDGVVNIPYSFENSVQMLTHKNYIFLVGWLVKRANDTEQYKITEEKENIKN